VSHMGWHRTRIAPSPTRVLTMAASVQCYFLFPAPIRAPERLSEPEIRVHPVMAGNGTCNVTFTCSAGERARHLTFTRTRPAGGAILSTEESLLVQHRLGDEDSSITCMATNPVACEGHQWARWLFKGRSRCWHRPLQALSQISALLLTSSVTLGKPLSLSVLLFCIHTMGITALPSCTEGL
uniref:Ig-like domain-containing protein n=1 Tax=Chelonoidis abingdonii TaxID=106734 RepID=A0A8C0GRJ2_CHEAB